MNSNFDRYEALRARMRERAERYPRPLQRLGDALWNVQDDQLSHAACLEELPAFIEAELAGDVVSKLEPQVKHHLDRCDSCAQIYAELLDTEWAQQHGTLSKPADLALPDLSFLPRTKRSLREVVLEQTTALLNTLAPEHNRELNVIAHTFFARVEQLGTFELRPGAAPAMGLGQQDTNPALILLAACYAATQTLTREITLTQFEQWARQESFQPELEARLFAAARAIGIERDAAARFARTFAEQIVQDPRPLRSLLLAD